MPVDTSTYHLRAASAWVTSSPVVTCKKIMLAYEAGVVAPGVP